MDFKYMYKNINYVFELTRYAKLELEELQERQLEGIDLAKILKFQRLFDENGELRQEMLPKTEEEQIELATEITMYTNKMKSIDVYEVGFIVLRNNKNYRDNMTRELFDEIVDDMEEKQGFEETYAFFKGVSDHVFTVIENLAKVKETEKKRKTSTKKVVN